MRLSSLRPAPQAKALSVTVRSESMARSLKSTTRQVLERAEVATGVHLRLKLDLAVHSSIGEVRHYLLNPQSGEIVVRYNPQYAGVNYAVADQAVRIERYLSSPSRYMIATTEATRARAYGSMGLELEQVSPGAADIGRELFPRILDGLLSNLVSIPANPWVVRRLLTDAPRLREDVIAGLRAMFAAVRQALGEYVAAATPTTVYRAANGMKAASALALAEILDDKSLFQPYHDTGFSKLAATLNELNATDRGAVGDKKTADAWARELDLVGWYEWRQVQRPNT